MKVIYVAGPYTLPCPVANVRKAIDTGEKLAEAGFSPLIPHLNHFWHLQYGHGYEFWMQLDFSLLQKCDALLRIPGYSAGADREVEFAGKHGIPVFFGIENLVTYFEERKEVNV